MKLLTEIFFYGYVGLLIVAGGWGVVGARFDHRLLFGFDPGTLPPSADASLVSQYRFLRAIELGFGVFSLVFRSEIFTLWLFNRVFLGGMTLGVVARLVSLVMDGRPRAIFYFFLVSEAIGAALLFFYTRNALVAP